jgi:hypothetical protein
VNRIAVLYIATLVVLTGLDFLFLGLIAKGFFTSEIGDMLGELKPFSGPVLSALCRRRSDLRQRLSPCDMAIDAALRGAVRAVLLCDVRSHRAGAAQTLELAGRVRRHRLGCGGDRGLIDRGSIGGGSCDRLSRYFGCGTMRM